VSLLGIHFREIVNHELYCATGAFDYEFAALDNLDNPLTKSYTDLVYSTFGTPTHGQILFMNLCGYFPSRFIRYVFETGSDPALQKVRQNRLHVRRMARELIEQKRREMAVGQSEKDILSLLGAPHHTFVSVVRTDTEGIPSQSRQMIPRTNTRSYEMTKSSLRFGRSCSLDTKRCQKL